MPSAVSLSEAQELAAYRATYGPLPDPEDLARARRYAPSRITIHNDLSLPEGFELTYGAEVRFKTGNTPETFGTLIASMRTTRQQGLVEISPYRNSVRADIYSGLLYLSEAPHA